MAKSAENRHHWFRLRETRKHYLWNWAFYPTHSESRTAEILNKLARTPKSCSCHACARNRHKQGYKAMHDVRWDWKTGFELRHKQKFFLEDFKEDFE